MSFTVYRSSAGSGKTFTLVKEYLKLILPDPANFRHILAITFTNKVANEMKAKILQNLRDLSIPSSGMKKQVNQDLFAGLVKDTGFTEEMIRKRAGEALERILHNYSDFAIGTIDSFSHRIIRTFAHDFGLPLNFTVELDSGELLETAVDLLLDRVGEDPRLTDLLARFLEEIMEDEKGWGIDRTLLDFAKSLLDEEGKIRLEKIRDLGIEDFIRISRQIYERKRKFESGIRKIAEEAVTIIEKEGIPDSAFSMGKNGIASYFRRLRNGILEKIAPSPSLQANIENDKWYSGSATPDEKKRIDAVKGRLRELFERIREERDRDYPGYALLAVLSKSIYPLAVLNEIDRILTGFKKQNNLVHISEFNRRIAGIILNEPVPFIYERLGEWYSHILIDEFQDTSVLQWNNLLPLVDNALASGSFNLVVGDGKQAIYRWRNGDVRQFASLPCVPGSDANPLIREREASLKSHYRPENLGKNFRSAKEIIDFNNRFFTYVSSQLSKENRKIYEGLEQESGTRKKGGLVRIEFFGKGDSEDQSRDEIMLDRILAILGELAESGFRRKEITVLCRSNDEAGEVSRTLMLSGIPVISSESLLLSFSPEVSFLVDFMRLYDQPADPMPKAALSAWLFRSGRLPGAGLHEYLSWIRNDNPTPDAFLDLLRKNGYDHPFGQCFLQPVYDLCEELIRIFSLNNPVNPYLQFFLDAVLDFTRKSSSGIRDFLDWWDLKKSSLSVVIPQGHDAVQVMTIHKAKGLQFPVVIFPFAGQTMRIGKEFLWIDLPAGEFDGLTAAMVKPDKTMLETQYAGVYEEESDRSVLDLVNILYVVMTRAEERLYVLSVKPQRAPASVSVPSLLKGFLEQEGRWKEDLSQVEYGNPVNHPPGEKPEETCDVLPSACLPGSWHDRIFLRWKAPVLWDPGDPARNREWGNLFHSTLAKIRYRSDLPEVMKEITAAGWIGEDRKAALSGKIGQILDHPDVKPFFRDGLTIKNEAEILLKDGTVYRTDRVIIENGTVTVLDYKTGKKKEKHREQLLGYEKYLLEMGYQKVSKYLLYLDPQIDLEEIT